MTEAMLRALIEALEAELARGLPTVTEAGRVFSAKNEAQLKAAVTALQALLAQVSAPPDGMVPGQPTPGQPVAPVAVPVAQAVSGPTEFVAQESVLPVNEAAVKDGKSLIRIITPGWGSSGFYSPNVLERDAPGAFPRGTKMFWDHPTEGEKSRPERSLRDLAAELTEDARWLPSGPEGPGVYSRARVFSAYQPAVEELAPHIGVSIRASAMMRHGEADGRKGPIVERLLASPTNSVDFVTIPGRGGRIASLFEAARGINADTTQEVHDVSAEELKAAQEAATAALARAAAAETAAAIMAAGALATETLAGVNIPDAAKGRIREAMAGNPPMKEGALDREKFAADVKAAAEAERVYIAALLGTGTVRGMGSGSTESATPTGAGMEDSFKRLGLSESAAKTAATGRGN